MNYWLSGMLVAMAAGLASSAHAGTIDLFCHQAGFSPTAGLHVSIDLGASTAAVWFTPGYKRSDVRAMPATVTSAQVTWTDASALVTDHFNLDRKTSLLQQVEVGRRGSFSYACAKDKPPV